MIDSTIKQLMEQYPDLKISEGVLYGYIGGYLFGFQKNGGYQITAAAHFAAEEDFNAYYVKLADQQLRNEHGIQNVVIDQNGTTVILRGGFDAKNKMQAIVTLLLEQFAAYHAQADICAHCGLPVAKQEGSVQLYANVVCAMHYHCARELTQQMETEKQQNAEDDKTYAKGILGAILGAVIGAIPMAVVYYFGYFAALLGILVGFAAQFGYEKLGGKAGKGKIWIVLGTSLCAAILAQLATEVFVVFLQYTQIGISITVTESVQELLYTLRHTTGALRSYLINLGVGTLFAAMGLIGLFTKLRQEQKEAHPLIVPLD